MSIRDPKVSVAMCVHNGMGYIDEALHSVFAQTLQDFEVIIVDDGSTDGTPDHIARSYRDPRVTLVRQQQQTLRVARPEVLAHSSGTFIAFLDHDDVWLPDKLRQQLTLGEAFPETALIFADCLLVDETGATIGQLSDQFDLSRMDLRGYGAYLELLRRGCFVAYSTAFVRAAAVRAVGGFSREYQYVSDLDLWLRLARRFELKCLNRPLAKYRIHAAQLTRQRAAVTLAEHTRLLRPIMLSASHPRGVRTAIAHNLFGQHRVVGASLLRQRHLRDAVSALLGSIRYPVPLRDYLHHRLVTGPGGSLVRRLITRPARRVLERVDAGGRSESAASNTVTETCWVDGTCLAGPQTGYYNLLTELIRRLSRSPSPRYFVNVATNRSGRVSLLQRLGQDAGRLHFQSAGWRVLHWSELAELYCGWRSYFSAALITGLVAWLAVVWGKTFLAGVAAGLLLVEFFAVADELAAMRTRVHGRARHSLACRLVRFLWRRVPAPRRSSGRSKAVELLFWRGRFRWRDSHRVAVVQDLTTRLLPDLHTSANVSEFDEFVRYVERYAHTVLTVSRRSKRDIISLTRVCPDRVFVLPVPPQPQYANPTFSSAVPRSSRYHRLVRPVRGNHRTAKEPASPCKGLSSSCEDAVPASALARPRWPSRLGQRVQTIPVGRTPGGSRPRPWVRSGRTPAVPVSPRLRGGLPQSL